MKKVIVLLLTIATLVSCLTIYTSADDYEIVPYYTHVVHASTDFNITSTGLARVSAVYIGYPNSIREVKFEAYLEKKVFGLFWVEVDIGQPDNIWVDYSYTTDGNFYKDIQLSDTGTYRAIFTITITGVSGPADVIENEMEAKYE